MTSQSRPLPLLTSGKTGKSRAPKRTASAATKASKLFDQLGRDEDEDEGMGDDTEIDLGGIITDLLRPSGKQKGKDGGGGGSDMDDLCGLPIYKHITDSLFTGERVKFCYVCYVKGLMEPGFHEKHVNHIESSLKNGRKTMMTMIPCSQAMSLYYSRNVQEPYNREIQRTGHIAKLTAQAISAATNGVDLDDQLTSLLIEPGSKSANVADESLEPDDLPLDFISSAASGVGGVDQLMHQDDEVIEDVAPSDLRDNCMLPNWSTDAVLVHMLHHDTSSESKYDQIGAMVLEYMKTSFGSLFVNKNGMYIGAKDQSHNFFKAVGAMSLVDKMQLCTSAAVHKRSKDGKDGKSSQGGKVLGGGDRLAKTSLGTAGRGPKKYTGPPHL